MEKEFLSGTLTTLILSLLSTNREMYGYEICKKVAEKSADEIQLTEGAIYPALHRLEKKGFINSFKKKVNGRIRKYYFIKESKQIEIDFKVRQLLDFTKHVQNILTTS